MSCSTGCLCKKGVVALVFVPGIMGTRLMNKKTGDSVWDPAAGMGFSGPSSDWEENKAAREAELAAAQTKDSDGYLASAGKWLERRWIDVKNVGRNVSEGVRQARTKLATVPRVSDLLFAGPVKRKALLVDKKAAQRKSPVIDRDDNLLDVDTGTDDYFRVYTSVPKSQMDMKRKRGWGEVHWDSYGPYLRYLESKESLLKSIYPGLQFPVFAVGYNWMLSNEKAGERLKDKLDEFKQHIIDEDAVGEQLGFTDADIKFIVISHSMGGFASRSGFVLSGLESKVEAVIHGAMPTHGSPSTYYQFRAGAAGGGVAKFVLGKNAADTTAILGFCQGGLELLPNQLYVTEDNKTDWLFYNMDESGSKGSRQLLNIGYGTSIYSFYSKPGYWYSMIQPELLAPELNAHTRQSLSSTYLEAFAKRIQSCGKFHGKLAANFHATTSLVFSTNPNTKAFDYCEWRVQDKPDQDFKQTPVDQLIVHDDENHRWFFTDGELDLMTPTQQQAYQQKIDNWKQSMRHARHPQSLPRAITYSMTLAKEAAAGDGTVHQGAGLFPTGVQKVGLNCTQDHQGFYNCPLVRERSLAIIQSWLPDIQKQFKGC